MGDAGSTRSRSSGCCLTPVTAPHENTILPRPVLRFREDVTKMKFAVVPTRRKVGGLSGELSAHNLALIFISPGACAAIAYLNYQSPNRNGASSASVAPASLRKSNRCAINRVGTSPASMIPPATVSLSVSPREIGRASIATFSPADRLTCFARTTAHSESASGKSSISQTRKLSDRTSCAVAKADPHRTTHSGRNLRFDRHRGASV